MLFMLTSKASSRSDPSERAARTARDEHSAAYPRDLPHRFGEESKLHWIILMSNFALQMDS